MTSPTNTSGRSDAANEGPRASQPILPANLGAADSLTQFFARNRRLGRIAFMPFVTVGDPNLQTTIRFAVRLAEAADRTETPLILELGFPYSDPIADGPAIQSSFTRALAKGFRQKDAFTAAIEIRSQIEGKNRSPVPMVAMVSYSLIHRVGIHNWLYQACGSGLVGAIVPDLPPEEAHEFRGVAKDRGFHLIHLVAPSTTPERVREIAEASTGFLYVVAVAGTTGERSELPPELTSRLQLLRSLTDLPICVGFGVSTPQHVAALAGLADGVIVGSAIVKRLEASSSDEGLERLLAFCEELSAPLASRH